MKNPIVTGAFIALALVQLWVPLSMIARRETVLRNGEQLKFRTAPVDPYDAFRGRYVALAIDPRSVTNTTAETFARKQRVFVTVETGEDGYTRPVAVSASRPNEGIYLAARVRYHGGNKVVNLRYPFDRYYMNERAAPEAERVYRQHSRRGKRDAHVTVRVSRGFAVLEELYIQDKPILEFMATQKETE